MVRLFYTITPWVDVNGYAIGDALGDTLGKVEGNDKGFSAGLFLGLVDVDSCVLCNTLDEGEGCALGEVEDQVEGETDCC